jgi:hypothetical protein
VASPKPFEVSGTLAPGQAGSAVKVSFQFGAGAPVFVTATTDAAGNWSASYTPSPNDTGTWTVSASYGGDSSRTGSTSPPCSIDYA